MHIQKTVVLKTTVFCTAGTSGNDPLPAAPRGAAGARQACFKTKICIPPPMKAVGSKNLYSRGEGIKTLRLRSGFVPPFQIKQPFFAPYTAAVSAKLAAFVHNTVAWNYNPDPIHTVCSANCPYRAGNTNFLS
jgi:hypothetical protein